MKEREQCELVTVILCMTREIVGKPEGKLPVGRPRRRLDNNIKTDFEEAGCKTVD